MNPAIARIKEALPLPILAGEYVKLVKRGSSWQGLCPFHSEKTASLRVHAAFFKCFGCDAKGDAISFLSKIEGISIGAAIRLLSDRTGIPLDHPQDKPRTRLQRAYDAQEMEFAEWWHARKSDKLARQVSVLSEYYAAIDEAEEGDDFWHLAESAGLLWRQFSAVPQSGLRTLALRCATEQDRREWAAMQSWARAITEAIRAA